MVVLGGIGGTHPPKQMPINIDIYIYIYLWCYELSTGLRMISLKTISSPCKRVESWIRLFPCFDLTQPCFFPNGPPIYPFFKTVVTCDVFYFPKTYDRLRVWGRHLNLDPWPYRIITLTTCCWVRKKKNLTPQEMQGLGSWSSLCASEHRFPKLPTIGWSWPSIVGRSSYQNSRWQWLQLRPFCFSLFEDWNCRNMTV